MQLAHFSTCSVICVIIYNLLRTYALEKDKARTYALIVSFVSIVFYYNATIIRDGIITIFILQMLKIISSENLSVRSLIKVIILLYLVSTFRIETALGCCLYLGAYYIINIHNASKSISNGVFLAIGIIVLVFVFQTSLDKLLYVYDSNYENYVAGVNEESGIMGTIQRLPPVIREISAIIFVALTPIPCWSRLADFGNMGRPECFNIMNFPTIISAFFNFYIIVYLLSCLFTNKSALRNKPYALKVLLVFGFLFMSLQTTVVSQRRIMSVYVLFYCLWALVHSESEKKFNASTMRFSVVLFGILQSFYIILWLI